MARLGDDPDTGGVRVEFKVRNAMFARAAEYAIERVDTGYACFITDYLVLNPENTNLGYGLRMFAHQVQAANLLGITQIWLNAVGDGPASIYNGSYSWARYGFAPQFTLEQQALFAERFPSVKDVPELMSTVQGRAAWRARGFSSMMCFDLTDERCWDRLEMYMAVKGVQIS